MKAHDKHFLMVVFTLLLNRVHVLVIFMLNGKYFVVKDSIILLQF